MQHCQVFDVEISQESQLALLCDSQISLYRPPRAKNFKPFMRNYDRVMNKDSKKSISGERG
jgi:hypothetical protein